MEIIKNLKTHIKFALKEVKKKHLTFLLLFTVFSGIQPIVYTYLIKLLIDELANIGKKLTGTLHTIFIIIAVTFIFSIFFKILSIIHSYFQQKINRSMNNLFTINLFKRISQLPLSFIETKQGQDALYRAQLAMKISPIEICNNIFEVLKNLITLTAFLTAAFFFSPWLIIILLITSLPFFIIEFRFNKTFYELEKRNSPYYREAYYLQQILIQKETLSEIKFFDYQNTICKRIRILLKFLMKIEMITRKKQVLWQLGNEVLLEIIYWSFYAWIILSFIAGKITLGSVTFFSSAYISVQNSIHNIFMRTNKILNDGLLLQNYYNVTKASNKTELSGKYPINHIDSITINNLSFKYPETDNMVLNNINIKINKGERVAFIGENGSGKTTMIKILLGFYPDYQGKILINGRDIREYDINKYRRLVSVSFQDYKKFFFKVKSMIAMKESREIDPEILADVSKKSGVEKHIHEMPDGYDTKPGYFHEKPIDFSGGQWQKLALARMFYRQGHLRILDEPTSSIDPESEIELYKQFLDNSGNSTTIAATHRIDLLEHFDNIIVFHKGMIVQKGSFVELSKDGYLFNLIRQKEEVNSKN